MAGSFVFGIKILCIAVEDFFHEFLNAVCFELAKNQVEMVWHETVAHDFDNTRFGVEVLLSKTGVR